MFKFLVWENIGHFRDRLWSEVDPNVRERLRKLLIAEMDKLGKDEELLADLDRQISDGKCRIDRQRALLAAMDRDGHNGIANARILLDRMLVLTFLHG